jgi:hypothetical protein
MDGYVLHRDKATFGAFDFDNPTLLGCHAQVVQHSTLLLLVLRCEKGEVERNPWYRVRRGLL